MHDKFKRKFRTPKADDRVRRHIATEAARRLMSRFRRPDDPDAAPAPEPTEAEYYNAKRQAAAVLGHPVRPGDLPTDAEVREQAVRLARDADEDAEDESDAEDEGPEPQPPTGRMADHIDRFELYRIRLEPLQNVKQNPRVHPEGDALYHSLQVFELARVARPYDEEFLLAALLHDVGKAIDPPNHVAAGLRALEGAITERTAWLIEHHMDLAPRPGGKPPSARRKRSLSTDESFEDLVLLRQLDDAGREPGATVGTLDEVLQYLRDLDREASLDDDMATDAAGPSESV